MSDASVFSFSSAESIVSGKPVIVLVHGGALSHRMYRTTIPLLNIHGYDVAAVDLPGHGAAVDAGPFTFANATRQLSTAIEKLKSDSRNVLIVGVSLGGQAVLDLLQHRPELVVGAIVSGASINPPDDTATWEMPHMPPDDEWLKLMTEDVQIMGMENAQGLQQASFSFTFKAPANLPPVLVVIGEHDVAMAKRDFDELSALAKEGNVRSEGRVLEGAWHNHPIDVPERFAELIDNWSEKVVDGAESA